MPKPPAFIPPSLPVLTREIPYGTDYTVELKLDGWRLLLNKIGASITIFSRTGNRLNDRFPAIVTAAHSLACRNAIIDGELIATALDGRPDF